MGPRVKYPSCPGGPPAVALLLRNTIKLLEAMQASGENF